MTTDNNPNITENTRQLCGVNVHYRVTRHQSAGAPVMVLMHGWGCNLTTLASIERVAAESCTVYNVDFPGFGCSEEPHGVWGVEEYTRVIEELAEAEGIHSPILLGHSFGGRVGLLFSSRNPVGKLILVDAAGIKPRHSLRYYWKVYTYKLVKRLAHLCLPAAKAENFILRQQAKRGSSDYKNSTPRMRAIMSKVVNEDLKHVMPSIKAPTLLVWGENDTATPLADAKTMEKLIPDAGLVSFGGCGHYSFLDNPVQFAAVLRSFLNA